MKKIIFVSIFFIYSTFLHCNKISAQAFTSPEYQKALWMTTRMFGGQRSGENNWFVYNHLPSGVSSSLRGKCFIDDQDTDGYDLSGGWHDAGDHVKFGQTQFYSAYMLLKGYAEFPTGYDDYYSYDYQGYKTSGDWSWEGAQHDPNGIPDVLDEVKHVTDFFIKCAKNSTTFYYQVGEGDPDHAYWMTAVKMQTMPQAQGGQPRNVFKNPNDASMPSFCGATLALMSRMYRKFEPHYADLCLQHALYAYNFAKTHPGTVPDASGGNFYNANANWKDDYATMCAELYWATNDDTYKTEALAFSVSASSGATDIRGTAWGFDYENNGDIALYNLALLGKSEAQTALNTIVTSYYLGNTQADGQFDGGNLTWGPLRYNINTALIVALWQKLYNTDDTPHSYIYDNLDYVLGNNSLNQSFIVGFGTDYPLHPHHRNVYLRDDNPDNTAKNLMTIPTKNIQCGLMVGGTRDPLNFDDDVNNYAESEAGIDYNCTLVGVLAFIISDLAPVDTSKFGHPIPNLGPDQSICGLSNITLDPQIPTDTKKTFTWKKDGVTVQGPSSTVNTYNATATGVYTCIVDSLGEWSTQSSIELLGYLPDVDLGDNVDLCNPASVTLEIDVTGSAINYQWTRDGLVIPGATSSTYTVYKPGVYRGTISAGSCTAKFDEVTITSQLPEVAHDTICTAGQVDLAVNGTGGPYDWFESATGGTSIFTGTNYSPTLSSSKTYYVNDGSSISGTAGPELANHVLTNPQSSSWYYISFTAEQAFSITEMKIIPFVYHCGPTVNLQFKLEQGSTEIGTFTATSVPCTGTQYTPPYDDVYVMNFSTPIEVPGPGTYKLTPVTSGSNALLWYDNGLDLTAIDVPGVVDILGDGRPDKPNSFPAVFDIKIHSGTGCDRIPVLAVVDPIACTLGTSGPTSNLDVSIFPNPSFESFNLLIERKVTVKIYDELGRIVEEVPETDHVHFGNNFSPGIYHVVLSSEEGIILKTMNVVKN